MFFGSISRGRKPKQFNFHTRFYNEDKEDLMNRYAQIEAEITGESSLKRRAGYTPRLRERWIQNKKTSNFEKKSNIRLVFIICLLLALSYWMLYF